MLSKKGVRDDLISLTVLVVGGLILLSIIWIFFLEGDVALGGISQRGGWETAEMRYTDNNCCDLDWDNIDEDHICHIKNLWPTVEGEEEDEEKPVGFDEMDDLDDAKQEELHQRAC